MVAAAITGHNERDEVFEDPSIGTLNFYYVQWDAMEPEKAKRLPIETKPCEQADLNDV